MQIKLPFVLLTLHQIHFNGQYEENCLQEFFHVSQEVFLFCFIYCLVMCMSVISRRQKRVYIPV